MAAAARRCLTALATLVIAAAGMVSVIHAQIQAEDPFARFYAGSTYDIKVGTFPGKLVCLSCDLGSPGAKHQCGAVGHRHALAAEDGAMVHPLIPGTKEVLAQINSDELHGKKVRVHGKYYPALGAILVEQVEPVS
jgi:hypothetical protein